MERLVQRILQRMLGFERYLFWFARFKLLTMSHDREYRDFFHFLDMIGPEDHVLDIGANVGMMTVLMARRASRGHVDAYEPIAENFRTLERICRTYRLRNVTLHQLALGDESGELDMVMPEESHVRMQGLSRASSGRDEPGRHYSVPVRRLDDLGIGSSGRIAAIKIDVENFELFVFRGAHRLLAEHQPLVYSEFWDNERTGDALALFRELGYSVQVYDSGTRALREVPEGHRGGGNYFLVPPVS